MAKTIEALLPPLIMALLFIAVVRTIIVSQNPQKRAAARARELEAEHADPRFAADDARSGSDPRA
jgi:hypothetical protein